MMIGICRDMEKVIVVQYGKGSMVLTPSHRILVYTFYKEKCSLWVCMCVSVCPSRANEDHRDPNYKIFTIFVTAVG